MTPTLGLFLGNFASFNVEQTTRNFGVMLDDAFELDLITTTPDSFADESLEPYTIHGNDQPTTRRGEFAALRSYLDTETPDLLTQIGDVPIYGNLISLLRDDKTRFVCRYSGDMFYEYRLERGLDKAKIFALKNLLGRVPIWTADQFIAMGPREKQRLITRGVEPTDVGILPPPVDSARFTDPTPVDLDVPEDRSVVLFVGRVERMKGAHTLETTIPEILDRRPDLQFVLVGSVHYPLNFPPEVADHVTVVGRVPPAEIPSYFAAADLYVHPSLTEGVSRSTVEALLSGTRLIARDVGDLATVTSNLFISDDDFVDLVCEFESLPVEDGQRFTVEALTNKYRRFFRRVYEEC
jgi:glycosyltransferase involved in cell wall biosynthesis